MRWTEAQLSRHRSARAGADNDEGAGLLPATHGDCPPTVKKGPLRRICRTTPGGKAAPLTPPSAGRRRTAGPHRSRR
jgi:hypothetical protein